VHATKPNAKQCQTAVPSPNDGPIFLHTRLHQLVLYKAMPLSGMTIMTQPLVLVLRISATISPYRPRTSPKIRIRTIPTNILDCCIYDRTPISPTIPIAYPAASPVRPTHRPAARCRNPLCPSVSSVFSPVMMTVHT
jgi:hypothetical protein